MGFPSRERWMSESHHAGIFDAVALGMDPLLFILIKSTSKGAF